MGSQLSLSPSHVERYYQAAETVLARAFPQSPVTTQTVRKTAADIRYNGGQEQQAYLDRFGIQRPLRALIFPGRLQQAVRSNWYGRTGPQHSGLYRARMQVSGVRPPVGQVPHLRIGKETSEAGNEGLIEMDVLAPEDAPQIVEFEVFTNNLPIDSFIASDWTMANARLSDFYGFPEPETTDFQRVALHPADHRGGLLTMGAILGLDCRWNSPVQIGFAE
ncbi:hypothetical protein SH139x_000548 [Planctomycetaceae bacterium SH139]